MNGNDVIRKPILQKIAESVPYTKSLSASIFGVVPGLFGDRWFRLVSLWHALNTFGDFGPVENWRLRAFRLFPFLKIGEIQPETFLLFHIHNEKCDAEQVFIVPSDAGCLNHKRCFIG